MTTESVKNEEKATVTVKDTKRLTHRETLCVEYFSDPDSETYQIWNKSYERAGYATSHGWKRNACKVRIKTHIQAAIEEKKADYRQKASVSREYIIEKLQDIAEQPSEKTSDRIKAMGLMSDLQGYKRETAPNEEREAQKRDMTAQEKEHYLEFAKARTEAESREKGVKLADTA